MKINDVTGTIQRLNPQDARKAEKAQIRQSGQETRTADGDSLELSPSARVPVQSDVAATAPMQAAADLSPSRVAEIQSRIASGFYDQPGVVGDTASRLLNFYSR